MNYLAIMPKCVAIGCPNYPDRKIPGITFHRFPRKPQLKEAWIKACGKENWTPRNSDILCNEHFSEDQFNRTLNLTRLKDNAVPNIFKAFPSDPQKIPKKKSPNKRCTLSSNSGSTDVVTSSKVRERARLKHTALPSLCLPVPEKIKDKQKAQSWKKQKQEMKRNNKTDKDGANALLLLSSGSLTGLQTQKSPLQNAANESLKALSSAKNVGNQPESVSVNSKTIEKPSEVSDDITSMQEFKQESFEMECDSSQEEIGSNSARAEVNGCHRRQENVLSLFRDETENESSTDSEEILFSENESEDSEDVLKEKLRNLTVCYKKSQRKLKEYRRLCKLYVKEVTALREVINNLKQINAIADNNFFEAKS